MELTKTELKKIIYDFNIVSSRMLQVNYEEYNAMLKKFLNFVEDNELIWTYIQDAGEPLYDIEIEVSKVSQWNSQIFELGDTNKEEVTNVYHILKYCFINNVDIPGSIAFVYSASRKFQDKVREFNNRVVRVLIWNIEAYLTKIGIDMGMDETVKFSITVNNGQVNLAADNSNINAIQNNNIDGTALEKILNTIKETMVSLTQEEKQTVDDCLEEIQNEFGTNNPKKSRINIAIKGLQAIKGSTEFGVSVATLIQFVQSFIR